MNDSLYSDTIKEIAEIYNLPEDIIKGILDRYLQKNVLVSDTNPIEEKHSPPQNIPKPVQVGNIVTQGGGDWFKGTSWGN